MASRIVLVTGASGAIGRVITARFAGLGDIVYAADLNPAPADDPAIRPIALDVSDEASWEAVLTQVEGEAGAIDVLVNGAGIHKPNIPFEDLAVDVWRQHFAVNSDGVFLGCKHAIRRMRDAKKAGAIVNLASGLGIRARASSASYCASKAAVLMTTRLAAEAGGAYGVRVNAILPGPIPSEMLMSNRKPGQSEEDFMAAFAARSPLRRLAMPEDIAQAVLFMASDAANAISGVLLPVDAGDMPGGS